MSETFCFFFKAQGGKHTSYKLLTNTGQFYKATRVFSYGRVKILYGTFKEIIRFRKLGPQ